MNGVLILDKPMGCTSADVVRKIKKQFKLKKVGHGGTLDPLATGLLPIFVNEATKIASYILESDKIYEGTFELGIETNTHDIQGEIILSQPPQNLSNECLEKAFEQFLGHLKQTPPMFSAVKKAGKPLYAYARQNQTVEREERPIQVFKFEMTGRRGNEVDFYIHCSKGSYVRTLCHDLAKSLGTCASLKSLRRLQTGVFHIQDSIPLGHLKDENLLQAPHWRSLPQIFKLYPHKQVNEIQTRHIRLGQSPQLGSPELRGLQLKKWAFLLDHEAHPLAIVEPYPPQNVYKLLRVFHA